METEDNREETPAPETQAEHPDSTGEHAHPHDDLRETVTALTERVSSLESLVHAAIPENRDESPRKKPWTHRRFGG